MPTVIKDKACIVGVGGTPQGRLPEHGADDIAIWAFQLALEDAGIEKSQVDGLLVQQSFGGGGDIKNVGRRLGMEPTIASNISHQGEAIIMAASLITVGICNVVACLYGTNQRTNRNRFGHTSYNLGGNLNDVYGMSNPGAVAALNFRRRMHDFGATQEQLGAVAVAQSKGASMNPMAVYRDALTIDDYLAARYVIWPLRLMDFSMISDGGFAVILTSAERAKDFRKPPVYVHSIGAQASFLDMEHPSAMYHPSQVPNAKMLWESSELKHKDIDAMYVQDAYTPNVLSALENYGFCELGTAHEWIQGGRIELGGDLPVNVNGGQNRMSYMVGWHNTFDAVQQLRNEAEERSRQVPNAQAALCTYSSGQWRETWSAIYRR
jgi:acetyl-CoA acetyltransferase